MSLESTIRGVLTNKQAPQEQEKVEVKESKEEKVVQFIASLNEANNQDPGEYDQEGDMAKTQLRGVMKDAEHMIKMFGDNDNLPEWVQAKIIKAADYLKSAHSYMMNKDEEVKEEWVCGKCNCDPCTCEENLEEKTLTPAELKKREEIAKAIERENPNMPMPQKMAIATAQAKKVAEATVDTADIEKKKRISDSDKDKIAKIADMMRKEREAQAKKTNEEAELQEAKKVSSMQIHKVLANTKNSREGIAALKKAFRVNDMEAKKMLNQVMNEETIDEISRSMTPMRKRFGGTVDPKKFDTYKKHMKTHKLDEPTVRMIHQNPDDAESKRMMKNPKYAQAVSLYKASMKEEVISEGGEGYKASSERSKSKDGHRAHLINPQGKTSYLGGTTYKSAKHAEGEAAAYHKAYFNTPGMKTNERGADRAVHNYRQANKQHVVEAVKPAQQRAIKQLELARKARAMGDHERAEYHTQLARQIQNEGTFISKFKEELKEKKRGMSETKGAPKGYHFTRSGQLKKGDAGQDGPGGKMLRSDPLDKQRNKIPPLPENDK